MAPRILCDKSLKVPDREVVVSLEHSVTIGAMGNGAIMCDRRTVRSSWYNSTCSSSYSRVVVGVGEVELEPRESDLDIIRHVQLNYGWVGVVGRVLGDNSTGAEGGDDKGPGGTPEPQKVIRVLRYVNRKDGMRVELLAEVKLNILF